MTSVKSDRIPAELRPLPQWVCWRYEQRNGKLTKVPKTPGTGENASVKDPSTWSCFEDALHAYERFGMDGIGFVLTEQLRLVAWDFDHCRREDGSWEPDVLEWVRLLDSYTEITPSGEGLRVFVYGSIPQNRKTERVEVYSHSRFMTVTGEHLPGTPTRIGHRQSAVDQLYAEIFGGAEQSDTLPPAPVELSDAELLQRAFSAENGAKFRALWESTDACGYPSASEADLALMSMLVFWCGGDHARAERLFSQSPRGQREKWRERADYRQRTAEAALRGKTDFYERRNGHREEDPSSRVTVMTRFVPRRFSEKILQEHRFYACGDKRTGDFYRYDTDAGIWRDDAEAFLAHLLRESDMLPEEWKKQHCVDEVIADVRGLCWHPEPLPEPPLHLLPFRNGVYDMETGELRPYRPEDGFTSKLRWDYRPDAHSEVLQRRLAALPENIRTHFWELLAYCLWRSYPLQRAFFWLGRGSNGKSYLTRLLIRALGEENVAQVTLHDLSENRFAVAQLRGKMLNLSGELRYDDLQYTDTLKSLCGGDLISADRKYKEPVLFRNHAKLLFFGNALPVTRDETDAFYRRAFVVEFTHQFREDPKVETELDTLPEADAEREFSWLLTQAVAVLRRLRENGFALTGDVPVEEKKRIYQSLSNPLRQFIAEQCEVTRRQEDYIYKFEFAERVTQWLQERGFNTYSDTRLGKEMREMGFEDGQRGEKKWRAWLGLRWQSHSSQGSQGFTTEYKAKVESVSKGCEPCEPCDEDPQRATPLGLACRAISTVLAGGRELTKHELHRATGLPSSVFEQAIEHMLRTGELELHAGKFVLVEVDDS